MRSPTASSVVVALSTFVAVATVSLVVSQLAPFDRAGATLPLEPITTNGEPLDAAGDLPTFADPADSDPTTTSGGTTVVDPAPADPIDEPVDEPVDEPDPPVDPPAEPPVTTPEAPGNSGNAPGQGGENPGNGNSGNNGNGKN